MDQKKNPGKGKTPHPHIFSLNRTLTYREKKAIQANPQLIGHYEFNPLPRTKAELLADSLGKQLPDSQELSLGEIYHSKDKKLHQLKVQN